MSDIIPTLNVKNWINGLSLPTIGILVLELMLVILTLIDENFPGRKEDVSFNSLRYYSTYLFLPVLGVVSIILLFGLWLGYSIINSEGNFGDATILGLIIGLIFGLIHVILFWIVFPAPDSETEFADIVWMSFYIAVVYLGGAMIGAGFKSSTK